MAKGVSWTEAERRLLCEYFPIEGMGVLQRLPGRSYDSVELMARRLGLKFGDGHRSCVRYVWTAEEDAILLKFGDRSVDELHSYLPDKPVGVIRNRLRVLGVSRDGSVGWTPQEDVILREFYPKEGKSVATRLPGRTLAACMTRASQLGVTRTEGWYWTEAEDDILRVYYAIEGASVATRLPGRSDAAIVWRAASLGLKSSGVRKRSNAWTESEDAIIREYCPTEGYDVMQRLPGRSRNACYARARQLGVSFFHKSHWSPEEDALIRGYYPKGGPTLCSSLTGRSRSAVQQRAQFLGVIFRRRNGN